MAQADPLPAALQTVYDQTCSDRMHFYGASRWHCTYFKSGGAIPDEDRRGWVVPRSFVWLDIINIDQNRRQLQEEVQLTLKVYAGAARHVVASPACWSRGWCLFEMAIRNRALLNVPATSDGVAPTGASHSAEAAGSQAVDVTAGASGTGFEPAGAEGIQGLGAGGAGGADAGGAGSGAAEPSAAGTWDDRDSRARWLLQRVALRRPELDAILACDSNSAGCFSGAGQVDQQVAEAFKDYFCQVMQGFDVPLPTSMSYVRVPFDELQRRLQVPSAMGQVSKLRCGQPLAGLLLHCRLCFDDVAFEAAGFSSEEDRAAVQEAVQRVFGGLGRMDAVIRGVLQACARHSFMQMYDAENW